MSLEQAVVQLEQTNSKLQEEVVRFRDSAMGFFNIYPTITEGRQAVSDGAYFSVPGNGAYMRLYRRQGSSAELIAEFPDRNELNSVIDQLGPLLGRGVVGGGGDLMAQGAFGLGGTSPETLPSFESVQNGGIYADGSLSTPGQPANRRFAVAVFPRSVSSAAVKAFALDSGFSEPREFTRAINNNVPMPWRENYHQGSILGTVSQSGGVPTGAIIERGSNANGEYMKLADGTAILLFRPTLDTSNISEDQLFDFPISVLEGASVQGSFLSLSWGANESYRSFVRESSNMYFSTFAGRWRFRFYSSPGIWADPTFVTYARWY